MARFTGIAMVDFVQHAVGRPLSGQANEQTSFFGIGVTYRERLLALERMRAHARRHHVDAHP